MTYILVGRLKHISVKFHQNSFSTFWLKDQQTLYILRKIRIFKVSRMNSKFKISVNSALNKYSDFFKLTTHRRQQLLYIYNTFLTVLDISQKFKV